MKLIDHDFYLALLSVFFVLITTTSCDFNRDYTPVFIESDSPVVKIDEGPEFVFGYLEVPEDRTSPGNRLIRLPVYIFKSRSTNPFPDPIVYTVGGPGLSTMTSAPFMEYYKYLDDRDFILIEQRGTKYAQPHLGCPEWADAVYKVNLPGFNENEAELLLQEAAKKCRTRLTDDGINLDKYNTVEIAADIEDLRIALGIDHYNLLTISYSTKIAQVLMRDYPDHIRSVVMDSPLPLEVQYDEESNRNIMDGITRVLDDCLQDKDCKRAFPDIKNKFFTYLQRLNVYPERINVIHPEKGTEEKFLLKGKDMLAIVTESPDAELPYEINKVLDGDMTSLVSILEGLLTGPTSGDGFGMRLSVWCSEESPFNDNEVLENERNKYAPILGNHPELFSEEVCDIWGVKKAKSKENKAIVSDIPTLLISGSYDSTTPSRWAASMKARLNKSHHLSFPGWSHVPTTNWSNPCAMDAARIFFNSPNVTPEPGCMKELDPFTFKVE
jgi:pimeloyl-ACP methyl ester carboxylesterase